MQNDNYEYKMLEAFVGKPERVLWYQNAFSKFQINGVDTMKWHWNWWGFFGGFLYLLYRKAYTPALILFLVSVTLGMIFPLGLIIAILAGGYSTYFVYKVYKVQKGTIENIINDEEKRIETMREIGGYHQWVIWIYGVFISLIIFTFFGLALASLSQIN